MTRGAGSYGEVSQRRRMSRRMFRGGEHWYLLAIYMRESPWASIHTRFSLRNPSTTAREVTRTARFLSRQVSLALSSHCSWSISYLAPPAMMKLVPVMAMMVCLAYSQRPPYAGSANKWPMVLPQYLEGRETTPSPPSTPISGEDTIGNRIDSSAGASFSPSNSVASSGSAAAPSLGASAASADIPLDLPVDARGDIELINRIKTWPRDKQPFWFINWQQIQEHRGNANNRGQASAAQVNTRSFFAG